MPVGQLDEQRGTEDENLFRPDGSHDNVGLSDEEDAAFGDIQKHYDDLLDPTKKKANSSEELKDQEGEGATARGDSSTSGETKKLDELDAKQSAEGDAVGKKPFDLTAINPKKKSNKNKALLLVGGGAGIGVLAIVIAIMFFLSSLKAIHFATVLRSTGFASAQLVMRSTFSQIAYDAAVLTDDSVGSLSKPERTMFDRLRQINPEKTMKNLGREGKFNVVTEGGKEVGFEINGKRFKMDEFAQDSFGKDFKKLDWREKLTVKNKILDGVSNEMADALSAESRSFRNGFFKGFEHHFNIRTSKWAQKARDLLGKDPVEAETTTRVQTVEDVTSGDNPVSTLNQVKDAAEEIKPEIKKSVIERTNIRTKEWTNNALKKVGIDDISSFSDAAGKVSVGVFVLTMYCTARDIDHSLDGINARKETQAQRLSHDSQTTIDQIKSGDVNGEAVGAANATYNAHGSIPDGTRSPFYHLATGGTLDGADTTSLEQLPTAHLDVAPIHRIFNDIDNALGGWVSSIPGVGGALGAGRNYVIDHGCSVALNPGVQGTVAGLDIVLSIIGGAVSGGALPAIKEGLKSAVVLGLGIVGGNILGRWIQSEIANFAGTDFTGAEVGVDKVNTSYIATDYTNTTINRGVTYGRPLSKDEAIGIKTAALTSLKQQYAQKSLYDRYFAIDNPYSLTGNFAAIAPTSFGSLGSMLTGSIGHIASSIGSLASGEKGMQLAMGTLGMNNKVFAAEYGNFESENNFFGVPQWGWTSNELAIINNPDNADTYSIIPNAKWMSEHNANGELDAKYEKCYKPEAMSDVPKEGCSADDLNGEKNPEVLRWRLFKLQNSVVDQLIDGQTITTDTPNAPDPSVPAPSTPVVGDTSNIPCPAGSRDNGPKDGWSNGQKYLIRTCTITDKFDGKAHPEVNSSIADNVTNLFTDARKAGINLTGWSFRDMAGQIAIYSGWCKSDIASGVIPPKPVAGKTYPPGTFDPPYYSPPPYPKAPGQTIRCPGGGAPGYSNHQMGFAIDMLCNGTWASASAPNSGDPTYSCFNWLVNNAYKYGLHELGSGVTGTDPTPTPPDKRAGVGYESWHWSVDGN
jgi:hypothetical protein